ncbi:MAG: hypothetical protein ACR2HK_08725 [Gemmatimonadales bacterium]
MRDEVDRLVSPFLAEADTVLGGRYSAVLYGSAVRGDFVPGRSDVNLMLILEDLSPPVLRSLGRAFSGWRKSEYEPPLLISRSEWSRATDVFPIEIADMRTGYTVLRGDDPMAGLALERSDLRRALEREFRGKLLRLRQGYAASAGDAQALGALAGKSAGTVLVLLRALLTLLGRPVPADPVELAGASADAIGAGREHLIHVFSHRGERNWRCSPAEFEHYLEAVAQVARFLDQLHLGDQ